ncbi:MAG: DNA polymerase III subunit beta [Chloroflexota bacterium]|nr:DNA polymerase III subunit beta [Chloroflexota bacterium]
MKLSCLQENLNRGLSIVGRAVSARSTLPILSNILLATDNGRLKLAATNLELGITTWVGADVQREGSITIPARLLTDFVNTLPNEKVSIDVTGGQKVRVSSGHSSADIHGMDAEDFPVIPTVSDEPTVRIEPGLLKEMIGQVAFAAATDDSRPVLAGVLVKFESGSLTMAAADGFRLAVKEHEVNVDANGISVIVPAKALDALARLIGDGEDPVEITVTPNRSQILFHTDSVDIVSRLVDGNFPNYAQIVPKQHETRTVVDTQEFLRATRRAFIFARDSQNVVRLQLEPGDDLQPGRIVITATAAEMGSGADELQASIQGAGGQIAFNAKYLSDVLSVVNTGQVALETQTSNAPGVIKPVGNGSYTHVIMPMHMANR